MVLNVSNDNLEAIKVFIGISFVSKSKAKYALTFQNGNNGMAISFPVQEIRVMRNTKSRYDHVVIRLVRDICNLVSANKREEVPVKLDIYTGSHLLSFIWEKEVKGEKECPEGISEAQIWAEIISTVNKNAIDLFLHGEGDMMDSINHAEQVRAKHV